MESYITVKANCDEIYAAFQDEENKEPFSIRSYEETRPGYYKVRIRHEQFDKKLEGTFTLDELREAIVYHPDIVHFGNGVSRTKSQIREQLYIAVYDFISKMYQNGEFNTSESIACDFGSPHDQLVLHYEYDPDCNSYSLCCLFQDKNDSSGITSVQKLDCLLDSLKISNELLSFIVSDLHIPIEKTSKLEPRKKFDPDIQGTIYRSCGVMVDGGYIVGGGQQGLTDELNVIVLKEAEILRDHFKIDVTIRFNSDRMSGGAWLVDSEEDRVGSNCSIGLGARLYNSRIKEMTSEEVLKLSRDELLDLVDHPDSLCFETAINLKTTDHTVAADSKHILVDSEFRDFNTLEEATEYLFSHVKGLRNTLKKTNSLADVISAASDRVVPSPVENGVFKKFPDR